MNFVQILVPALIAFLCTCWIFPYILKVAKCKNIVDNPDARKLQRTPVPVLGGLSVVFGVLIGTMSFNLFGDSCDMFPIFASIIVVLIIGLIDDMIQLSPKIRFIVEILLVLYMIVVTGHQINNFYGLWGLDVIPNVISIPLTILACVGIINAINLVDGVDGYSSGYCIMASSLFGVMFYMLGNIRMATLAAIVVASLIPFFFHNVFGKESKMFIGDAGTLAMGIVMSTFVTNMLTAKTDVTMLVPNFGLIPFTLAVMCVPVFDTVRVMLARIARKKSPFHADKTHLHHLFIELGFSHLGTAFSILCMNSFVVLCWYCVYKLGLSMDVQLYVVIALGLLITFVFYKVIRQRINEKTNFYNRLYKIGSATHLKRTGFWHLMQKWADK